MISSWFFGIAFSLVFGHLAVEYFYKRLHQHLALGPTPPFSGTGARIPAWLTGFIERLFFTVLVGISATGTPMVMMLWLGLKLVTNWNHPDYSDQRDARTFAYAGLLSGLLSMFFALIGGTICASGG